MYLLDTDTLSNALGSNRSYDKLRRRMVAEPPESIFISVITLEEQLRGALSQIHKERNSPRLPRQYALLEELFRDLHRFNLLPYDQAAAEVFQQIPTNLRQHHSQDCRIAAIALSRGMIVVTRNQRHFEKIPGIQLEDWT